MLTDKVAEWNFSLDRYMAIHNKSGLSHSSFNSEDRVKEEQKLRRGNEKAKREQGADCNL